MNKGQAIFLNKPNTTSNPVSSPDSTPSLTQSTSGSNNSAASTSQSPPLPSTPPSRYIRGTASRSKTLYPADLARTRDGRTPLHRRGTSQKYEPFEDLLREAGYKETRIFTPETERVASGAVAGARSRVSGVVGFLSGFIPGSRSSSLKEDPNNEINRRYSPPTSPSPMSRWNHQDASHNERHSLDDDATPRPSPYLRHIASVPDMPGARLQRSHSSPSPKKDIRRRTTISNAREDDDDFNSVYEGRTRGNGEGEEDTNVPPLPKTWLETVARAVLLGSGSSASRSILKPLETPSGSRAVSHPTESSLPHRRDVSPELRRLRQTRSVISRTESLADATQLSRSRYSQHSLTRTQSARSALSSRSGLSDRTSRSHWNWVTATPSPLGAIKSSDASIANSLDAFGNRPRPTLLIRLDGSSRSGVSESEIRKTKVVCRSAPPSRAASPHPNGRSKRRRDRKHIDEPDRGRKKNAKGKGSKSKSKSKSRSGHPGDEPPSLTRMVIELESNGADNVDRWLLPSPKQMSIGLENHRGWGNDSTQSSALPTSDYDSDGVARFPLPSSSIANISDEAAQSVTEEEDSSENEVDLAKMLRPKPQRQQSSRSTHSVSSLRSIRSLRKLLNFPAGDVEGISDVPPVPPLPGSSGTVELSPPPSATGRWFDIDDSYEDGNGRYGTTSARGKRGSLPTGWTGASE
ncbi:hypothetical protein BDP27DRAFT_1326338 [Rhodocollybia butyracea]|uniref:Uncharacterized protein n=1 Tax=Rhodocollybia butyracea TaxID=206335 RepID=A0A9P5U6G3_9AGAR|nr:hypothetical protein BDP27DRAFT_1326338 [Rhodocollybia butyracea]